MEGHSNAWDPDRMSTNEVDAAIAAGNWDLVWSWFDHPNTEALHEDIGRSFRSLPPEEQIPDIEESLRDAEEKRARFEELAKRAIRDREPDELQRALVHCMLQLELSASDYRIRLAELEQQIASRDSPYSG